MNHFIKLSCFFAINCYAAAVFGSKMNPGLRPEHFYARIDLGAAWMSDQTLKLTSGSPTETNLSFDAAFQGQLGAGYIFKPYWRTDFTYTQSANLDVHGADKTKGDVSSGQLLLNAYFDFGRLFAIKNWINPYVGAGFGWAHNKIGKLTTELAGVPVTIESASKNEFAWRAMAGIAFAVSQHFSIDMAYTYTDAGSLHPSNNVTAVGPPETSYQLDNTSEINMRLQQVMAGVRYRF